jgi:hypothetical protein
MTSKRYLTINNAVRVFSVPEHWLRRAVKQGEIPGFYSRSRFYLDAVEFERRIATGQVPGGVGYETRE